MDTTPLVTHATWEGDLDDAYDTLVGQWLAMQPGAEASLFYREHVFPLTCERLRRNRDGLDPLDLLFIPVGTQPYAPTLAALANPAACVALLVTEASAPYGRQVADSLQGPESLFLQVRVHETDVADIALAIRDVFDSRSLPSGSGVGADTTGGTKVMTAAMAGVGSLYGWRLFYVASQYERAFGLSHHERIVLLDNVLDVFGARRREEAMALLRAGACSAAERAFRDLAAESAASEQDRRWAALAAAAGGLRRGEPGPLRRNLRRAAQALGTRVPRSVGDLVQATAKDCRSVLLAQGPQAAALAWLGASVCLHEDGPPAARALAEAAAKALGEAVEAQESTSALLRRLAGTDRLRACRGQLGWLDHYLGAGLPERLAEAR